jgi:hypothetical protein
MKNVKDSLHSIRVSEVNEAGEPIEYACEKNGYVIPVWLNLTINGQWVSREYLRPDDVRWTVVLGGEVFRHVPPTAAEKLVLLLQNKPYKKDAYNA